MGQKQLAQENITNFLEEAYTIAIVVVVTFHFSRLMQNMIQVLDGQVFGSQYPIRVSLWNQSIHIMKSPAVAVEVI